jgi:uncharacterized repeat protein (TIGR03803 family)
VGGVLYGTTRNGGSVGNGTVFAIRKSGSHETVIHSFKGGGTDGKLPLSGLVNVGGVLYGTTYIGGASDDGTVFAVTPSGTESLVYSFKGSPDGIRPSAGLTNVGGTLYGTTNQGGANSLGTLFAITPSGAESVIHSFGATAQDGATPLAGLINVNGTLYGTTSAGGANGVGTVFSLTP